MSSKPTIYIEPTVISAYFDFKRQDPQRKRITRLFWRNVLPKYLPVISDVVIVEVRRVAEDTKGATLLNHISQINRLPLTTRIEKLAEEYIAQGVIRKTKLEDALHLAISAINDIDYLVSWNYKDLVRATQRKKIAEFHNKHKLPLPIIATPLEFFDI